MAVPVGESTPRWLCWRDMWPVHTLVATHTQVQLQRRYRGGDTAETLLFSALLGSLDGVEGGVDIAVGEETPRWLFCCVMRGRRTAS